MCIYITRGDSCSTWLCKAVGSTPPSSSFVITGVTSSSVSTRSPITHVISPVFLNATHEPRARACLSSIPETTTFRSLRGKLTLYTSPGCIEPALTSACSTGFQSAAAACCWLFDCPDWFCGAEQVTSTDKVAITNATTPKTTLLVLRARDNWTNV